MDTAARKTATSHPDGGTRTARQRPQLSTRLASYSAADSAIADDAARKGVREHGEENWEATAAVISALSGKWVLGTLRALQAGPLRHNELLRVLGPTAHARTLDETLRRMSTVGLVTRTVHPGMPPAVYYRLTDLSRSLLRPLSVLGQWAASNPIRHSTAGRRGV